MTRDNPDLHAWLSSKAANFLSWISAGLGLGTAIGIVNLAVGILSAGWLTAQLWNWWTFTRPANALKLQRMREQLSAADAFCDTDSPPLQKTDS